jgi:hypothetical protein
MFDCSKEIRAFQNDRVKLSDEEFKKLRAARNANRDRLKAGLKRNEQPKPLKFQKQGSYAMRTGRQHPNNDYDIDDGAVFNREELKGAQGADKTALAARQMVCEALRDDKFKKQPEVLKNCVRVYYQEGHHVDVPVYRHVDGESEANGYELASSDWKKSNPQGVTRWFEGCLAQTASADDDSDHQMRREVRLMKAFCRSRESWEMPSGFILTKLVTERYYGFRKREDEALYAIMLAIKLRLDGGLIVQHPVLTGETLTKTSDDADMRLLREKLEWAIEKLSVLHNANCTRKAALKAWKEVFDTDYFDDSIAEGSDKVSTFGIMTSTPKDPVDKRGGERFG